MLNVHSTVANYLKIINSRENRGGNKEWKIQRTTLDTKDTRRRRTKQNTQYIMCCTPLCADQ